MPIPQDIQAYNAAQSSGDKRICDTLAKAIDRHLAGKVRSERRIWHRHPVWFLRGNPIVGYSKLKGCIRLLFWSGQSFDEPGLAPEGSFKAAEARFTSVDEISTKDLARWLSKSILIQWDYKNIVKRKGRLERLKGPDWRGETLARVRMLITQAVPGVVEEQKWAKPSNPAGVPVWSHDGIICTGETYKTAVKLTFAKGASLADPSGLFNSSLEGNTRRAIDLHEGDTIDERAFKALVRAAAALNTPVAGRRVVGGGGGGGSSKRPSGSRRSQKAR